MLDLSVGGDGLDHCQGAFQAAGPAASHFNWLHPGRRVRVRDENSTRNDLGCRGIPCKNWLLGTAHRLLELCPSHGWSWRQRMCPVWKSSKFCADKFDQFHSPQSKSVHHTQGMYIKLGTGRNSRQSRCRSRLVWTSLGELSPWEFGCGGRGGRQLNRGWTSSRSWLGFLATSLQPDGPISCCCAGLELSLAGAVDRSRPPSHLAAARDGLGPGCS